MDDSRLTCFPRKTRELAEGVEKAPCRNIRKDTTDHVFDWERGSYDDRGGKKAKENARAADCLP